MIYFTHLQQAELAEIIELSRRLYSEEHISLLSAEDGNRKDFIAVE